MDEVKYVSGETRIYAIVGHPIEQVRSPEMVTAELVKRGHNAILIPIDVLPVDFERTVGGLTRVQNLDGLIFTIPFKQRACALADELGRQARTVGAINAMARDRNGKWFGDIFDGIGCLEAFRNHDLQFKNQRVMLIGAGGAGRAIGVAVAYEGPAAITIYDIDERRAAHLSETVATIDPKIRLSVRTPVVENIDILLNASPVGMLSDPRAPIDPPQIPSDVVVFDAIVKPEITKLLAIAQQSGCRTIFGREMMRGQIAKIVDYFEAPQAGARRSTDAH
jgi:shikimate dehydrogenase